MLTPTSISVTAIEGWRGTDALLVPKSLEGAIRNRMTLTGLTRFFRSQ